MRLRLIATIAVAALSMTAAFAGFTAYNDSAMTSTGNITNWQTQNTVATPVYTPSGLLKDYASGANTGVTCTATASGTLVLWTDNVVNVPYAAGTDAANHFNSVAGLNFQGSPELNSASEWYKYTFSGLDPNKKYNFTTTMNRNGASYTTRTGKYTISEAISYTNASSAGATIGDAGASATFCNGYNTVNGYVARWTDIVASANGTFSITVIQGNPGTKAYGFGVFKLEEVDPVVPEPGSMLALGSGLLGFAGFAVRRRIRK